MRPNRVKAIVGGLVGWVKGLIWGLILWFFSQVLVTPMMGGGIFSAHAGGR